ncbi:hypothetical protein HZH66_010192 [Vespula vulgaris]|uniref:Uncharacterized protein n=2 Tax=Vespula TaxID=7451 RepID=A0A834U493_VESPE|nr:hypothetical protein HZH66_010192 [Vespula vulgaris]KAF7415633.1 hypothetical protein H0235_012225 [Vespula pensylvanica]
MTNRRSNIYRITIERADDRKRTSGNNPFKIELSVPEARELLARLDLAIQVGPPRESPGGHLPAAIRDLAAITKLRLAHVKVY